MSEPTDDSPTCVWPVEKIDAAIEGLEARMESLQARHTDVFALASSWAAHHDAIIAATPEPLRPEIERRLQRIGIRWGVARGRRMSGQIPVLKG